MQTQQGSVRPEVVVRILTWAVRAFAVIEAIDAVLYVNEDGFDGASGPLLALMVLGIAGATVAFVTRAFWMVALGGLAAAAAPSMLYPLSAVLALDALALLVFGTMARRAAADAASVPAPPAT